MDIKYCMNRSHKTATDKGWHDVKRTFGDLIALCHSELSEALEEHRNKHTYDEIYFEDKKPCGIAIELADTLIRIFDMCEELGIPLENALDIKMNYNDNRLYRHGGKAL